MCNEQQKEARSHGLPAIVEYHLLWVVLVTFQNNSVRRHRKSKQMRVKSDPKKEEAMAYLWYVFNNRHSNLNKTEKVQIIEPLATPRTNVYIACHQDSQYNT